MHRNLWIELIVPKVQTEKKKEGAKITKYFMIS